MKTYISLIFLLTIIFFGATNLATGQEKAYADIHRIIPKPRVENYTGNLLPFANKGGTISISIPDITGSGNPVKNGLKLFTKRLDLLGGIKVDISDLPENAQIKFEKYSEKQMLKSLQKEGATEKPDAKKLSQAYFVEVGKNNDVPFVSVKACSDLGFYYGLVSLCQIVDNNESGEIALPELKIADWPEIGFRLAKTSATTNPLSRISDFADWMPLYKINLIGLQFHGEESKETELFRANVKAVCNEQQQSGLLEPVVYFCPFRGNGYDFTKQSDKDAYLEFIDWVFDQGADGFEVDYNDWPGTGVPIEDVVNLAYDEVIRVKPDAYVLYCPPNRGQEQYRGPATPEMTRTLSKIPAKVWPLWTGMKTLVTDTLKPEEVEEWTDKTGRRPFFWLNRASNGVDRAFSRSLTELPEAKIAPCELLPKELNSLFEGIHLNFVFSEGNRHTLPETVSDEELVYFATLADYIWNPYGWNGLESYKRAKRFVEIMHPLVTNEN